MTPVTEGRTGRCPKLPLALYFVRHTPLLRSSLASGPSRTRGDGRQLSFSSAVACTLSHHKNWVFFVSGILIVSNLGIHTWSPKTPRRWSRLPNECAGGMRTGKHIEPHSPLDFGEPVRYRALQRLLARPYSDEVLLAEAAPFDPEVKFRSLAADELRKVMWDDCATSTGMFAALQGR